MNQTGVELIAAERQRQIEEEGWTPEHDDEHNGGEMALAAGVYALISAEENSIFLFNEYWPATWENWFKPKDRLSNLVRAGALIAAEIDRLQRSAARK